MINQLKCCSSVSLISEWAPEELCGFGGVLAEEEFRAGVGELVQAQETVIVGVDGLEGGRSHGLVQTEQLEEEREFVAGDLAIFVVVNCLEEQGEGAFDAGLHAGVLDVLGHLRNEVFLVQSFLAARQELVPDGRQVARECGGVIGVHLCLLGEARRHALEILPGDCSILVKVNPGEVSLHLLYPEIRHDGGLCVVCRRRQD